LRCRLRPQLRGQGHRGRLRHQRPLVKNEPHFQLARFLGAFGDLLPGRRQPVVGLRLGRQSIQRTSVRPSDVCERELLFQRPFFAAVGHIREYKFDFTFVTSAGRHATSQLSILSTQHQSPQRYLRRAQLSLRRRRLPRRLRRLPRWMGEQGAHDLRHFKLLAGLPQGAPCRLHRRALLPQLDPLRLQTVSIKAPVGIG